MFFMSWYCRLGLPICTGGFPRGLALTGPGKLRPAAGRLDGRGGGTWHGADFQGIHNLNALSSFFYRHNNLVPFTSRKFPE